MNDRPVHHIRGAEVCFTAAIEHIYYGDCWGTTKPDKITCCHCRTLS